MNHNNIPADHLAAFADGMVIPAMPLALNANRRFDEARQRALIRYYIDAGAGGVAAGVHSTQFEIRDPKVGLFEPVLSLVAAAADEWSARAGRPFLKVAGCSGQTAQAVAEAELARGLGYHACLVSLSAFRDRPEVELVDHCAAVAKVVPIIGFYLQPAVGGTLLTSSFWRKFAELDNVIGIKIAPFNRYQTIDVLRGVCEAGREDDITLYTGNDDNIVADLLTEFRMPVGDVEKSVTIKGGLLGHWGFWTKPAVELLAEIKAVRESGRGIPSGLLTRGSQITDANAAVFDPANKFRGCIPGIHEMLRRQGLLEGTWCLNSEEVLSPGQSEEISRVCKAYPEQNDDTFVRSNLDTWLS